MARQRGFTLIELMIVVAVIAILAVIAVSSYKEQVHKSRRASAYNDIAQLQLQLERWRAENPSYARCSPTPCGSGTYPARPTNNYYTYPAMTVAGISATATSYTLTATPQGAQLGDRCGVLTANGNAKPTWGGTGCN